MAAIAGLWVELMDFHRAFDFYYARSAKGEQSFREYVRGGLENPEWRVVVAEREGQLVGYCLAMVKERPDVMEERRFGLISDMLVTESERRKGVGERLARAAQDWFAEQGIVRTEVVVAVANRGSGAFWRKMGYVPLLETLCRQGGDT